MDAEERGARKKKKRLKKCLIPAAFPSAPPAPVLLFDVNKVKFVCLSDSEVAFARKKFARGISESQIQWLEGCHYASMTDAQAAQLPSNLIRPGHVDIRKVGLKYIRNHKHRWRIYLNHCRGIRTSHIELLNQRNRIPYFAWKIGYNRKEKKGFRNQRYLHVLNWVKKSEPQHFLQLYEDDDFLQTFLFRFRCIELGFDKVTKENGEKARQLGILNRKNFIPYGSIMIYCLDHSISKSLTEAMLDSFHKSYKSLTESLAEEGLPILQEFLDKEKGKTAWSYLFSKKPIEKLIEAHVAVMLFGAGTVTASNFQKRMMRMRMKRNLTSSSDPGGNESSSQPRHQAPLQDRRAGGQESRTRQGFQTLVDQREEEESTEQ